MFKTATSHLNMDTRPGYTVDAINLGCREETIFMTIFFLLLMSFQFKVETPVEKDIHVHVPTILIVS